MLSGGSGGGSSSNKSITTRLSQALACMGGCFGGLSKPAPIIAVDEPSKGFKIQGRTVKKLNIPEDLWSTNTYDMDNGGIHLQSTSISASVQTHEHGASSSSNPCEFVNHGLLIWNQTRVKWLGSQRTDTQADKVQEHRLSRNATYDSLLGSNKPFPHPIPLSEMVNFLVDVWEQDGMYD